MTDIMELFQNYKNDVYRLAVSYTHSIQEAEDVCQTVFLKLMEQKSIKPGKEKAWLMQVTANQCKSLLRSARWKKTEPLGEETVSFDEQEYEDIWAAVMKLKPGYRAVGRHNKAVESTADFKRRIEGGLTYAERIKRCFSSGGNAGTMCFGY